MLCALRCLLFHPGNPVRLNLILVRLFKFIHWCKYKSSCKFWGFRHRINNWEIWTILSNIGAHPYLVKNLLSFSSWDVSLLDRNKLRRHLVSLLLKLEHNIIEGILGLSHDRWASTLIDRFNRATPPPAFVSLHRLTTFCELAKQIFLGFIVLDKDLQRIEYLSFYVFCPQFIVFSLIIIYSLFNLANISAFCRCDVQTFNLFLIVHILYRLFCYIFEYRIQFFETLVSTEHCFSGINMLGVLSLYRRFKRF